MNSPHTPPSAPKSLVAFAVVLLLVAVPFSFAAKGGGGSGGSGGNSGSMPATKSEPDFAAQMLIKYDLDHNGRLDKNETARIAILEPDLAPQVAAFDLDHNGSIDTAELSAWRDFKKAQTSSKTGGKAGG